MKKKILRSHKKRGILLIMLLSLVMLFGCGRKASEKVDSTCNHKWNGMNGTCELCGVTCEHQFNEKGRCTICKYACEHEKHDPKTLLCTVCNAKTNHEFVDSVCKGCGKKSIFSHGELPEEYNETCKQQGTIKEIEYNTYAYAIESLAGVEKESIAIVKKAYVYLPYGYNEDSEYDILYLMHGGGGGVGTWFGLGNIELEDPSVKNNVPMIDQVFYKDKVSPCLIVTPTFYSYAPEDSEYAAYNDSEELNDLFLKNFRYEMKDLIQAVESQYATYARHDVTDENLQATRAHRAYAGLSMGARISFASILSGCLDYVGYIGSFSGSNVSAGEMNAEETMEWVRKALNETYPEEKIYYWYHGEGTLDPREETHKIVYDAMLEEFPDRLSEESNIEYVLKEGYGHDMRAWHIDLYNVLHVFFTK